MKFMGSDLHRQEMNLEVLQTKESMMTLMRGKGMGVRIGECEDTDSLFKGMEIKKRQRKVILDRRFKVGLRRR